MGYVRNAIKRMLEGYSKNLYGLLRKCLKLPRPDEIWKNVPNKWGTWQILLYGDMALSLPLAYAGKPISIFNTIVGLLILFKLNDLPTAPLIIFGIVLFFFLLIVGHVGIVGGLIRRGAELQNSQNTDLMEIRDNVRKLLKDKQ